MRRQDWPLREGCASGFSELGKKHETTSNRALLAAGIALAVSAATALPAVAATSESETLSGTLVISGVSGTRPVISSVLVAKPAFRGVGRIVELPDLATGPAQLQPDDLVLSEDTMHLVSATVGITSFALNPRNCLFRLTQQRGRRDTWCDAEPSLTSPLLASPHRTPSSARLS